jgi:predicted molibdopterin-dependent oxidoreductase YjgC
MSARLVRLAETSRPRVCLVIDGQSVQALEGDTVLVAILTATDHVRDSEFGDGRRAGFCFMGACQDCWVWTEDGRRLRACSTVVQSDMRISTRAPEETWSNVE